MAELYVCRICGEPYIGGSEPDDCPFCGAPKIYLKKVEGFSVLWKTELTEQEKADIQETLKLEVNATAYYTDVMKVQEKYCKYDRLYKQLTRVEMEHAELASKFLKIELPILVGEKSKGAIEADLKRTQELEHTAVELYSKFLKDATHENVKHFFVALIHAERSHEDIIGRCL
jgi:rubrerythrin